jgi:hypothetical protein
MVRKTGRFVLLLAVSIVKSLVSSEAKLLKFMFRFLYLLK